MPLLREYKPIYKHTKYPKPLQILCVGNQKVVQSSRKKKSASLLEIIYTDFHYLEQIRPFSTHSENSLKPSLSSLSNAIFIYLKFLHEKIQYRCHIKVFKEKKEKISLEFFCLFLLAFHCITASQSELIIFTH